MLFSYICTFIKQKEWPDGRAERRGVPELQTKLDQLCLYEYVVFRLYLTFVKQKNKSARAIWKIPPPLLGKGLRPPALEGRARARARAKYNRKSRNLTFFQGKPSFWSRQKLFSSSNLATVQNFSSIRAGLEKLWSKWVLYDILKLPPWKFRFT